MHRPASAFPELTHACAAELLQISNHATPAEVNAAFKKLALTWHPDKVSPEHRATATVAFQRMLAAKDLLLQKA